MRRTRVQTAGVVLLGVLAAGSMAAGLLAPHNPATQFSDSVYAPPMPPRIVDADGHWHLPFYYPLRLVDRLERRYAEDVSHPVRIRWSSAGPAGVDESRGPWLPLGGDALGRDLFARMVWGARLSLGIAGVAAAAALALGSLVGAVAGYRGGVVDELLMRITDFVLVLPAIYVVLALRASMPLVLSTWQVFWTMSAVFALAGWPYAARGVRGIVAAERRKEYAESARAIGAGGVRILLRHLLPAARGFLAVQGTLLLPAFILAEATLSYVGLGFAEPTPSWGVMLQDAGRVSALAEAPWLLAPAFAIVLTVLSVHLTVAAYPLEGSRGADFLANHSKS